MYSVVLQLHRRLGEDRDKLPEGGTSTYILHLSGLAESLAYPGGEDGVDFLVQMISTCLPSLRGRRGWGSAPYGRSPLQRQQKSWSSYLSTRRYLGSFPRLSPASDPHRCRKALPPFSKSSAALHIMQPCYAAWTGSCKKRLLAMRRQNFIQLVVKPIIKYTSEHVLPLPLIG